MSTGDTLRVTSPQPQSTGINAHDPPSTAQRAKVSQRTASAITDELKTRVSTAGKATASRVAVPKSSTEDSPLVSKYKTLGMRSIAKKWDDETKAIKIVTPEASEGSAGKVVTKRVPVSELYLSEKSYSPTRYSSRTSASTRKTRAANCSCSTRMPMNRKS